MAEREAGRVVLARKCADAELGQRRERARVHGVQRLAAGLRRAFQMIERAQTAADPVAALDHQRRQALLLQQPGGVKPGDAGADDENVAPSPAAHGRSG